MESVPVSFRPFRVATSALGGRLQLPLRRADVLDGMRRVTTGANRCIRNACIESLAVGSLEILRLNPRVAGSAGLPGSRHAGASLARGLPPPRRAHPRGTARDLAEDEQVRKLYLGKNFELRTF